MDEGMRIGELASLAGVSRRTVHYYASRGLIPPAEGAGANSYYTVEHLDRLRLVKRLQDRFLGLEEIRALISPLTLAEVRAKLAELPEVFEKSTGVEFAPQPQPVDAPAVRARPGRWPEPGTVPRTAGEDYVRYSLGQGAELHWPAGLVPGAAALVVQAARAALAAATAGTEEYTTGDAQPAGENKEE